MITHLEFADTVDDFSSKPVRNFELIRYDTRWVLQPRDGSYVCARFTCDTPPTKEECETIIRLWAAKFNIELADELQIRRVRE